MSEQKMTLEYLKIQDYMGSEKPRKAGVPKVRETHLQMELVPQLEQSGERLPRAGGGSRTRVGLRKVWAV